VSPLGIERAPNPGATVTNRHWWGVCVCYDWWWWWYASMPGVKLPHRPLSTVRCPHTLQFRGLTEMRPWMRLPCIGATPAKIHARPISHLVAGTGAEHATVAYEGKRLLIGRVALTVCMASKSQAPAFCFGHFRSPAWPKPRLHRGLSSRRLFRDVPARVAFQCMTVMVL
jgi:hypothetical protein